MPCVSRRMRCMNQVPRVIHWWWDGPPVPPEFVRFRERWAMLHPLWDVVTWDEDRFLSSFSHDHPVAKLYGQRARWSPRAHEWGWKTNIARLLILHHYGGLWVDADLEPLKSVDTLIERIEGTERGPDAIAAYEDRKYLNNAFLASTPGGRFITEMVNALPERVRAKRGKPSNVATGPHFLTDMARSHPDGILALDRELIYPMHWSELDRRGESFPDAFTVHHWHRKTQEPKPSRHRVRLGTQPKGEVVTSSPSVRKTPPPPPRKKAHVNVPSRIRKLPGLTPEAVAVTLADMASQVPQDQAIVELGVYQGRTALFMAWGAGRGSGAHIYAVDPWDLPGERDPFGAPLGKHRKSFTDPGTRNWARYNTRALGYANQVTLIRDFSTRAAESYTGPPVGLLFVDGDHTYDAVRADVRTWSRHLTPDAKIAFDDYAGTHPEVVQAVDDMVSEGVLGPVQVFHDRLAVTRLGSGNPELVRREQVQDQVVRGEWVTDPTHKVDLSPGAEVQRAEEARQELAQAIMNDTEISTPPRGIEFPLPDAVEGDSTEREFPGTGERMEPIDFDPPHHPVDDANLPLTEWAVPGELGLDKAVKLGDLTTGNLRKLAAERGIEIEGDKRARENVLGAIRRGHGE